MATNIDHLSGEFVGKAIATAINDRIRSDLKSRVMAVFEKDIEAIIDQAVESMNLSAKVYNEGPYNRAYIDFVVRKNAEK